MNSIITYDLEENALQESKHSQVKDAMKELGYFDSFVKPKEPGVTYYLPNTTLWKKDINPATAKDDLLRVAAAKGATVERLFADEFTGNYSAIPGKPYAKKLKLTV